MNKVFGMFLLLIGSSLMGFNMDNNYIGNILIRMIACIFFFMAIKKFSNRVNPISELMPYRKGDHSILWVTDGESGINEMPSIFNSVGKVTMITNLISTNERYPQLKLEKCPVFVIFDKEGLVLKTYKKDEAIQYLEEKYEGDLFKKD